MHLSNCWSLLLVPSQNDIALATAFFFLLTASREMKADNLKLVWKTSLIAISAYLRTM